MRFRDRSQAGELLAEHLSREGADPIDIVLGVPRGGVVVAAAAAERLGVPVDVIIARKVGAPFNPELAIGAVTSGGHVLWNDALVSEFALRDDEMERMADQARTEVQMRMDMYRSGRAAPALEGRRAVLIDDGIATGFTVKAALCSIRGDGAEKVVLAVPVAPKETLDRLRPDVDEIHCLRAVDEFWSVGSFYEVFPQVPDSAVIEILKGGS